MTKFTTFFGLHFAVNIFNVSEQLSTTMQTKGILAQTVVAGVQCLKDNLQHRRNDYDVFCGQISDKAAVISVATNGQNRELLLPSVVRLIQIYLLAPMSAASAERSFSVQRQIKSYFRNTMSEKRYDNLLALNIHKERTDNVIKLAREFVQKNDRRLRFFGKF